MTRPRRSPLRIAAADARSAGGALALLGSIVALAAALTVAAPAMLTQATSLELARALADLPEESRNPSGQLTDLGVLVVPPITDGVPESIAVVYGPLQSALDRHRQQQPEPLRSALGDADVVVIGEPFIVEPAVARDDDPRFQIRTIADPASTERLSVISGRLPEPWDISALPAPPIELDAAEQWTALLPPIEIVLTPQGAEALRWSVGERRVDTESSLPFQLVGLVDPVEPDSAYWSGIPAAPDAERFDDGNQQPRETAAAFVHPLSVGAPRVAGPISVQYPFDIGRLDASSIDAVLPQLRSFVATEVRVPSDGRVGSRTIGLTVLSSVPAAADAVLDRVGVTQAILALTVAGPLGAFGIVLVLAARAVSERRRAVLALRLARGASRRRVRGGVASGALALTLPSALAGVGLGALATLPIVGGPVAVAPANLAALLVVVLAPAIVLAALVPRAGDTRERRTDLTRPGPMRSLVDLVIVVLAALSVWFVLQRGVVASAQVAGLDPILVMMPLLVAVSAAVLTNRAYPVLLELLWSTGVERRSAIATIGLRRASRDRTVGPVVVATTLLVTAVAVSSVSVLTAVDAGLEGAARDELGASVRVTGPGATEDFAAGVAALPEVGAVGGIAVVGPAVLSLDRVRENATVIALDDGAIALRDDLPDGFGAVPTPPDSPVAVVMSADLLPDLAATGALPDPDLDLSVAGVDVTVAALGRVSTGYGSSGSWVLVPAADAERFAAAVPDAGLTRDAILIEPAAGLGPQSAAAAVDGLARDQARADTRIAVAADRAAAERGAPLTAALRTALIGGAALAALLGVVALVIAAAQGRPRRQRAQALALVLGVARSRALVAWELGPPSLVGIVVGTAIGAALAPLTTAAADLRFVTGQGDPVSAVLDPVLLAAPAAALTLAVLAVIAVATALDRRPPLLDAVRTETP